MRLSDSALKRFHQRVKIKGPNECWEWQHTLNRQGYGHLSDGRSATHLAHRVAFFLKNGYVPAIVRHSCDNPPCCNPQHLLSGTHADNQRDKKIRGRAAKGEANGGGGKLTESDVRQIRQLITLGQTNTEIGKQFDVTRQMIGHIRRNKKWQHLK